MEAHVHVLVFPFPVQGHINPMLQFSKRLAFKGSRVTFINTNSTAHYMQSASKLINLEDIEFEEGAGIKDWDEFVELFNRLVSGRLMKFIERQNHSQNPPHFLVYDSVMPWVLDVARRSGIDAAPFFTQSWAVNAVYYQFHEGKFKSPLEQPSLQLPALPTLGVSDVPSFIRDAGPYPGLFHLFVSQFSKLKEANLVFCNTFDKLEDEVITWMANQQCEIKTIGPAIPSMYLDKRLQDDTDYGLNLFKPNLFDCIKWLDSKEDGSVVYLAFGSLAALGEEQMHELAWGLERSNSPFLWVVRETEQKKLPKNFVEETREQGLVVSWSPQLQVLAHRAVGCFVTHCGWNSTLEALSLGIPMVAMPQWTDQPTNAKFVTDVWGVGVRVGLDENGVSRKEEIECCIREAMEGDIRKNSSKWKEMAMEAVSEGGSSDKNIDEFIAELLMTSKADHNDVCKLKCSFSGANPINSSF